MDDVAWSAPHRLALTGPEWAVLCRRAGVPAPTGFGVGGDVPEDALVEAERTLVQRNVLTGADPQVHPSLLANLAVWASPTVVVQVELAVRDAGLRATYAVLGPVGGSLLTLPDGGVELSMFPSVQLGVEVVRAVPEAPVGSDAGARIEAVLSPAETPAAPVRGRLPLSALAEFGPASAFQRPDAVAGGLELTAAETALAAEVTRRTAGVLRCLVVGSAGGTEAAGAVLAGQVVWLATDAGWVGLRPHPEGTGRQLVDLVPVRHDAIGGWLAPYVARILEVAGDRT